MVQLAVYNAFLIYKTIASGLPMSCYEFSESHGNIFCSFFPLLDGKELIETERECIGKRISNKMNAKRKHLLKEI